MINILLLCAQLLPNHAIAFSKSHSNVGTTNISILEYEGLRSAASTTTDKPEKKYKKRFSKPSSIDRFIFMWRGMENVPFAVYDKKTDSYAILTYTNKVTITNNTIRSPKDRLQ